MRIALYIETAPRRGIGSLPNLHSGAGGTPPLFPMARPDPSWRSVVTNSWSRMADRGAGAIFATVSVAAALAVVIGRHLVALKNEEKSTDLRGKRH